MPSIKQQLATLAGKSFAEEIEQDKKASFELIRRAEAAQTNLNLTDKHKEQELKSCNVYKRALIMMGSADLEITSPEGKTVDASNNNLPVSSYLSHGSRTLIQIPPGSGDELINWLTSGVKTKDGRSRSQDHNKAVAEGKYVYNRSAATHDVSIQEDGKVKEEKGFLIGARDYFANKLLGRKTNHWGVDLAAGTDAEGIDASGNKVEKPDGDHGHLYIHYIAATENEPGSILIGMEGAAPRSSKHSKIGNSDVISPTGGSKFGDLATKKQFAAETEYETTVIPKKYNGIYGKLDNTQLDSLIKAEKFGVELATALPAASAKAFKEGIDANTFHKTPIYRETKKQENPTKKPNIWKNIINKITFGFAYKKEVSDYKLVVFREKISLKDKERVPKKDHGKTAKFHQRRIDPELEAKLEKIMQGNLAIAKDSKVSHKHHSKRSESSRTV